MVLEEYENARARGARMYCEMLGYGQSADAYDLVAVDPDGSGVRLALTRAFAKAGIGPGDVDYINAHGTSTPIGDPAESKAIEKAFGEHAHKIGVSSTKSMHGHALGAAGGIEGVATVLAVARRHHAADDQLRISRSRMHAGLRAQRRAPRADSNVALSNSFGFGGHNSVIVFGKVR